MRLNIANKLIVLGITTALLSCHTETNETKSAKQRASGLRVEGYVVKPSFLDQTITVSGTLKPFEETVLMSDISGRVITLNLPEGERVKQGTLLVKLFDSDLQAQLQKAQAQLQIAEQTLKRQAELIKVNGVSQSDYDQAKLQTEATKADIEVLKAQIRKTEVRAPFDGSIGLRNISVGAQVTPNTPLVTIRDVSQLKLDLSVPEKYSSEIKPGTKLKFTLQSDDQKYDAVVIATEEGIETETRNLKVRAVVKKSSSKLIPGAFATVDIRLKENNNALLIPTQAIIPQARDKSVILANKGKAKFMIIKTGIRTAAKVEVISGIHPGDTVVTTGVLFLKPNAPLKFSKVKRDSI